MKKYLTLKIIATVIFLLAGLLIQLPQTSAQNILLVSGHSDSDNSIANKTILTEVKKAFPEAELLYLDKVYPNFKINIDKERQRVSDADIIVMQYPIYWYAPPAIMKRWQEEVFTFGFAHDANGGLLGGKTLILSMTSGAPESDYCLGGRMNYPMEVFQIPLRQFADLCGMSFGGVVYSGGYNLGRRDLERDRQITQAKAHANRLIEKIKALQ